MTQGLSIYLDGFQGLDQSSFQGFNRIPSPGVWMCVQGKEGLEIGEEINTNGKKRT